MRHRHKGKYPSRIPTRRRIVHKHKPIHRHRVFKKGKLIYTRRPKEVLSLAKNLKVKLKPLSRKIELAGSIRRKKPPTDIDILVMPKDKEEITKKIKGMGETVSEGPKKVEVRIKGVKTDVVFADKGDWGSKLLYLTGSAGHNIGLRMLAKKKGMKLNQYGLWKDGKKVAGKTEKEIYEALGRPRFKKPEERNTKKKNNPVPTKVALQFVDEAAILLGASRKKKHFSSEPESHPVHGRLKPKEVEEKTFEIVKKATKMPQFFGPGYEVGEPVQPGGLEFYLESKRRKKVADDIKAENPPEYVEKAFREVMK